MIYLKKNNKKYKNNKFCFLIIILLLLFSYYEITNDLRLGGVLRDILFKPISKDNYSDLYTLLNTELKKENDELKSILEIDYSQTDFSIVNATIIERNNNYWLNELIINKGSEDKIENNQMVITKDGMIGKVISTSKNTSIVKLLPSFNSPIPVTINDINKIMYTDNYSLFIRGINDDDKIKIGDKVLSGISENFPKGILIGTVDTIYEEDNKIGYIAKVSLSSNINDLRFVSILVRNVK